MSEDIQEGERLLAKADPVLAVLIDTLAPIERQPRTDYFESLSRSIVSQQVSVAAARAIFGRYVDATQNDPQVVDSMDIEQLRALGLSRQKASYLKDLAAHFVENKQVFDHLEDLPDEMVITELTGGKGVGEWTAQMFLMSTLNRLDVFAPADAGLQRAIEIQYPHEKFQKPRDYERFAERWRPYRTIACWYLWKSLDNDPNN